MAKCFGTQITRCCLQKSRNVKIQKQLMHFITLTQECLMPFGDIVWKIKPYFRSHLVLVRKKPYTENWGMPVTAYRQYLEGTKTFLTSQKAQWLLNIDPPWISQNFWISLGKRAKSKKTSANSTHPTTNWSDWLS